jgi:hypothetical protein
VGPLVGALFAVPFHLFYASDFDTIPSKSKDPVSLSPSPSDCADVLPQARPARCACCASCAWQRPPLGAPIAPACPSMPAASIMAFQQGWGQPCSPPRRHALERCKYEAGICLVKIRVSACHACADAGCNAGQSGCRKSQVHLRHRGWDEQATPHRIPRVSLRTAVAQNVAQHGDEASRYYD